MQHRPIYSFCATSFCIASHKIVPCIFVVYILAIAVSSCEIHTSVLWICCKGLTSLWRELTCNALCKIHTSLYHWHVIHVWHTVQAHSQPTMLRKQPYCRRQTKPTTFGANFLSFPSIASLSFCPSLFVFPLSSFYQEVLSSPARKSGQCCQFRPQKHRRRTSGGHFDFC